MSYHIGKKIKNIRLERGISQDDIAARLGMSRQRFARIENGQDDISFVNLQKIAEYFSVPTNVVTTDDEEKDLVLLFREKESSSNVEESVEKIVDILKTFHAHEKLYYRMKEKNNIED